MTNIYVVIIIYSLYKVMIGTGIKLMKQEEENLKIAGAFIIGTCIAINIVYINPLVINSVLNYIGIDKSYNCLEALPLTLLINLITYKGQKEEKIVDNK